MEAIASDTSQGSEPRRGAGWPLLVALALTVGWPLIYYVFIDIPVLRSTGLAAFVAAALGVSLAVWGAARNKRLWARVTALVNVVVAGMFVFFFVYVWQLPRPTPAAESIAVLPDMTLVDHNGREVSLRSAYASGPLLLVFYRGHW